jgi:cysteinyl-tRNA synthetase
VEKIITNGFAYATPDGSVYFDIQAFEKAGHPYPRLEPWSRNDKGLQADGEGSLTNKSAMKRNENDFALWKASKQGEPSWPSPWGHGRPGWHIECSCMASDVLGSTIDLHSGGEDLKFPHHDNELAQSTAYWSTNRESVPWTNYFLHTGHLSIQGLKMSKSLKNFTTIRTILADPEWSARSLRICFLLGAWQERMEMTDGLAKYTAAWEAKLNNFFRKSIDLVTNPLHSNSTEANTAKESGDKHMQTALEKAKADLDAALCDSFNTPVAMRVISDLITECNSQDILSDSTVLSIARWVTRIVTIFGLDHEGNLGDKERVGWSGIDIPAYAKPYVLPAAQLRDEVRHQARSVTIDHAAIAAVAQLTEDVETPQSAKDQDSASKPYDEVLSQFRADVKKLADEKAPARDLLALVINSAIRTFGN